MGYAAPNETEADFSARAAVHAARIRWEPSPMAGAEGRMLDRVGEEVARATSIVRYAPDSHFSAHRHGGGGYRPVKWWRLDGTRPQTPGHAR